MYSASGDVLAVGTFHRPVTPAGRAKGCKPNVAAATAELGDRFAATAAEGRGTLHEDCRGYARGPPRPRGPAAVWAAAGKRRDDLSQGAMGDRSRPSAHGFPHGRRVASQELVPHGDCCMVMKHGGATPSVCKHEKIIHIVCAVQWRRKFDLLVATNLIRIDPTFFFWRLVFHDPVLF